MKQQAKQARDTRAEATNRLIDGQNPIRRLVVPKSITTLKKAPKLKPQVVQAELQAAH